MRENIILIGMPGSGKSTLGVVLAKMLGMDFIDTDLLIQRQTGKRLQEIVNESGVDRLIDCEEQAILGLEIENTLVATGGSVVYREKGMAHLKQLGRLVYLRVPYHDIEHHILNISTRGIAIRPGQTLFDLYKERTPLYEKYADTVFDVKDMSVAKTTEAIYDFIERPVPTR
ncbi:MAG: shikimate kinase [Eubacteriales bacterium]|nr:shikimate kinase [Eubacteriales bacterium]MDD3881841.1 shikimate kinase [Eubacteriales bacterium]MDD4512913.1 shikimate kinase [Eubacteriales bacterium]